MALSHRPADGPGTPEPTNGFDQPSQLVQDQSHRQSINHNSRSCPQDHQIHVRHGLSDLRNSPACRDEHNIGHIGSADWGTALRAGTRPSLRRTPSAKQFSMSGIRHLAPLGDCVVERSNLCLQGRPAGGPAAQFLEQKGSAALLRYRTAVLTGTATGPVPGRG
jgi:hypothetical protein